MTDSFAFRLRVVTIRLLRDRSGAGLMMGMFAFPVIMLFGIVTLDVGQLQLLRMRTQQAADAAAMAGALSVSDGEAQSFEIAERIFAANMTDLRPAARRRTFRAQIQTAPDGESRVFVVTAAMETDLLLGGLSGALGRLGTEHDRVAAVSRATVPAAPSEQLEMAIVVDNSYPAGCLLCFRKWEWQQRYAEVAIDALFEGETTHPERAVAIVPYSATVNAGRANGTRLTGRRLADIDSGDDLPASAAPKPYYPTEGWLGCVSERSGALLSPDRPGARVFPAFFAPRHRAHNNWDAGPVHNWAFGGVYNPPRFLFGRSPNLGCPRTAMMPLTHSRAQAMGAVDDMTAWLRGGAISSIGMAWARRLLSPEWAGLLAYPDTGAPTPADLPSTDARKLILLLGSGEDRMESWNWTGFGRRNRPVRENQLDDYFADSCTAAKADGIEIVTVRMWPAALYGRRVDTQRCASDPSTGAIHSAFWPGAVSFFYGVHAVSRTRTDDAIRDAVRAFIDSGGGGSASGGDPFPRLIL